MQRARACAEFTDKKSSFTDHNLLFRKKRDTDVSFVLASPTLHHRYVHHCAVHSWYGDYNLVSLIRLIITSVLLWFNLILPDIVSWYMSCDLTDCLPVVTILKTLSYMHAPSQCLAANPWP